MTEGDGGGPAGRDRPNAVRAAPPPVRRADFFRIGSRAPRDGSISIDERHDGRSGAEPRHGVAREDTKPMSKTLQTAPGAAEPLGLPPSEWSDENVWIWLGRLDYGKEAARA